MIPIETVCTDSFEMDYFRFGVGKEAFVILPGLSVQSVTAFADGVAEAYGRIAEEYTVYVLDRRKKLPDEYSVYDMARDTALALRALGLDGAALFGASQGGMIALKTAIDCPSLVKKLVVCSSAGSMRGDRFGTVEKWIALAKAGKAKELYLSFGEAIYPPEVFEEARGFLAESAQSVTASELKRFAVLAEGMRGFDVLNYLKRVSCPVFVIGSSDDRVLGAYAAGEIARQFEARDDCEFFTYDGFGHAAYDTAPDFKERVLRFLKK